MKNLLCLSLLLLTGCGSSLNGSWTCSVRDGHGPNGHNLTLDFECRSDGSVTVNGQKFWGYLERQLYNSAYHWPWAFWFSGRRSVSVLNGDGERGC